MKVADFGAAFITGIETTQRVRVGSPSYIAPEQIRDEPLTHQSDMFSLGVVLYELLCGVRPFRGANVMETLDQVLRLMPPAPSQLRPELPAQIDPIVLRMIQKLPAERYANWAELALDLARVGRLSLFDQADHGQREVHVLARLEPAVRAQPTPRSGNWCAPATGDDCRARRCWCAKVTWATVCSFSPRAKPR